MVAVRSIPLLRCTEAAPTHRTAEEKEGARRLVQLLARNFTSVTRQMLGMDAVLCKRRRDETDDSGVKKRFLRGGGRAICARRRRS
jgi:hypothetical protein